MPAGEQRGPEERAHPGDEASRRNEGVGEHVRTRFHVRLWGLGKIADQRSAPNGENLFLLPDRFRQSELFEKTIQPSDLMSRRHPLSSTRAIRLKSASRSKSS